MFNGKWKMPLIKFAFKVLKNNVVDKLITYEPLHKYVASRLEMLEKVVDKLTDKDPNDIVQLRYLWETEKDDLFDSSLDIAAAIVLEKIKDPETAQMVSQLLLDLKDEEIV